MNLKFTELTRPRTNSDIKNLNDLQINKGSDTFDTELPGNHTAKNRYITVLITSIALTASGMITALSMPGFNVSTIAWFGFIPLIATITLEKSLNKSLFYSFLFGLGFYGVSLSWFLALHPLNWLGFNAFQSYLVSTGIWLAVTAYLSCYVILFGLTVRIFTNLKSGNIVKSAIISLCWVFIMNKLTSIGPFAFPWALIEYSQYKNLNLLQMAQYIGGIGIGFLIMFFNCNLSFLIVDVLERVQPLVLFLFNITGLLTFILIFHAAGNLILHSDFSYKTAFASTVIQNYSRLEDKQKNLSNMENTKKYFINQINISPSGLIVLPEAAIDDFIRSNDKKFYQKLCNISKFQNKTLVIGALDFDKDRLGKLRPTNSAIITDKNLKQGSVYNKQFLVPFGEYLPFREYIPFYKFINSPAGTDFYPGSDPKVIKTSIGKIAPTICYEIVFPDLIKKQIRNNADILVNLSSLCWYHDSIIKDQFIAFGVMRAAEFRKPFIIAVNTGYSALIDYNGKIIKKLPKNVTTTETVKLNYKNEKTFYSKLPF